MSERQPAEPDAVAEARARSRLPRTYRGDVDGDDVRVVGRIPHGDALLIVQVIDYENPEGEPVAEAAFTWEYDLATTLDAKLDAYAEEYDLDEVTE